ncbi:MAG TPA: 3-hydroxyacyl-CoA dehydrogenase [Spirochaetota bacterium]|nr:3-hydroxyacyl-CoA dehydrogenase [Spirochaetota bacterium]
MKINDIKKVLLLGAGTMGQQISIPCALAGFDVVIYDINEEALKNALRRIPKIMSGMVLWKKITQEEADAAFKRITTTTDPELAAKDADIVNESVPEKPELKVKIFSQFNKLCPERTIFTTNTSTLLPSKIAAGTGRPEKFLALHFHDVSITNVVDIMPHPGTSKETTALVKEFAEKAGQLPIMMHKESSGYVFNYMIGALFTSAQTLATQNVASIEDIDRAWMGVTHMMQGPFGMMDGIGLDTMLSVTEYWASKNKDPQWIKNAEFLRGYVEKGHLGMKTKKGFYEYPKPAYNQPEFLKGIKN